MSNATPIIVLKAYGGLANRIYALLSGVELARVQERQLQLIWEKNQNLCSHFHELFCPLDGIKVEETTAFQPFNYKSYSALYNTFSPDHYRYPYFNRLLGQERKYEVTLYNDPEKKFWLEDHQIRDFQSSGSVYIAAHNVFFDHPSREIPLRVLPPIAQKITEITSLFDDHTVGIHVRRTDRPETTRVSTNEAFFKLIDPLMEEGYRFFLASDDPAVKEIFLNRFGGNLMTNAVSTYDRSEYEAIESAVIDLYALSQTTKIIGSYSSSFSKLAAQIGDVPLIVAGLGNEINA